jgi:hypothetical protein
VHRRGGVSEDDALQPARWLCGTFTIGDPRASHLLASLPAAIILRGDRSPALEGLEVRSSAATARHRHAGDETYE